MFLLFFIQFIVMCTCLSIVKKLEITTPLLFSHIHTNSIHPTNSVSKINMPQNNLIIVDFQSIYHQVERHASIIERNRLLIDWFA